jgi:hypothetical protein
MTMQKDVITQWTTSTSSITMQLTTTPKETWDTPHQVCIVVHMLSHNFVLPVFTWGAS